MSAATRRANRTARRIIRFTRTEWNVAQLAAWTGGYGSAEARNMETVSRRRGELIATALFEGNVDAWRLRTALRAAEVKG